MSLPTAGVRDGEPCKADMDLALVAAVTRGRELTSPLQRAATGIVLAAIALLLVGAEPAPVKKLDPVSRAKVLMALTGLVLLGCGMAAGVMLGGRMVRRLARARVASRTRERAASSGPWLPADPLAGMADPFDPPEEGGR